MSWRNSKTKRSDSNEKYRLLSKQPVFFSWYTFFSLKRKESIPAGHLRNLLPQSSALLAVIIYSCGSLIPTSSAKRSFANQVLFDPFSFKKKDVHLTLSHWKPRASLRRRSGRGWRSWPRRTRRPAPPPHRGYPDRARYRRGSRCRRGPQCRCRKRRSA